jgi:hypothetical protein
MQAVLNESQATYRYVVISLSSVSWSAFQSMLALTLYGPNFDPDWIVAMDGYNDMACSGGGGVRGAVHSHTLEQYFRSYLYHNPNPPFYRGASENELVRASALYRILTQQRYVPPPVTSTARWEDIERSLAFYELSYDRLFRFFSGPEIKMLMSSQPNKDLYRADLDLHPDRLDAIARRHAGADCRHVPNADVVRYFGPRLKQVAQQIAARWKSRLNIRYLNMNDFLPEEPKARNDLFWGISNLHFVDKGQDLLARIYARTILESDLPGAHAASPAAEKN